MRGEKGFTLLEIVISILILVIITTMTAFNIRRSVKVKARVEQDMDDYSAVRDALVIITKDVNMAFHYIDVTELMENRINQDSCRSRKTARRFHPRPKITTPTSPPICSRDSTVNPTNFI